jgi:hypothetical protein
MSCSTDLISRFPTLPGIGPDTLVDIAEASPALEEAGEAMAGDLTPVAQGAYEMARRLDAWDASLTGEMGDWFWQTWMDASRDWRWLNLTPEEQREAVMWISRWTRSLFGR